MLRWPLPHLRYLLLCLASFMPCLNGFLSHLGGLLPCLGSLCHTQLAFAALSWPFAILRLSFDALSQHFALLSQRLLLLVGFLRHLARRLLCLASLSSIYFQLFKISSLLFIVDTKPSIHTFFIENTIFVEGVCFCVHFTFQDLVWCTQLLCLDQNAPLGLKIWS